MMNDDELLLIGGRMPYSLSELAAAFLEARARGLDCAADDARLFGNDELGDHFARRATGVRMAAINRPPRVEVHA